MMDIVEKIVKDNNLDITELLFYINDNEIMMSSDTSINNICNLVINLSGLSYDYDILAKELLLYQLYGNRFIPEKSFTYDSKLLYFDGTRYNYKINPILYNIICNNNFDDIIVYSRDKIFNYHGLMYILSIIKPITQSILSSESPQHHFLRVAIEIVTKRYFVKYDLNNGVYLYPPIILSQYQIREISLLYSDLSNQRYSFGTPAMIQIYGMNPQTASCFVFGPQEDSLSGILYILKFLYNALKYQGGCSINLNNIRCRDSYLGQTNSYSAAGIVPILDSIDTAAAYFSSNVHQRKSAVSVYLEITHADFTKFIVKAKKHDSICCKFITFGVWVPDEFMRCVKADAMWYMMDPLICSDLFNLYDYEFESQYIEHPDPEKHPFTYKYRQYVKELKYVESIKARILWQEILRIQLENGGIYLCFKDHSNRFSNQIISKYLGKFYKPKPNITNIIDSPTIIQSSNVCTEIYQINDSKEFVVCNLGNIKLPKFIKNKRFMFDKFAKTVMRLVKYANIIIDLNSPICEETMKSNKKNRPLGIGVSGFADVLCMMGLPFESEEAHQFNVKLFEHLQYYALLSSCLCSKQKGHHASFYSTKIGTYGIFLHELYGKSKYPLSLNWEYLRDKVQKYGLHNLHLIALMPTSLSANIYNVSPSFEPPLSVIYTVKHMNGESIRIYKPLVDTLKELSLWNKSTYNDIITYKSIQDLSYIPKYIKNIYKGAFEIDVFDMARMCAERAPFICQGQSFNVFLNRKNANIDVLNKLHMEQWGINKAKTSSYYIRVQEEEEVVTKKKKNVICNDTICMSCSG
jgi:ribonucleoside-diphosphate reductase alpha subunit